MNAHSYRSHTHAAFVDKTFEVSLPLKVRSISDVSEILALEKEWTMLEEASDNTILFQSFNWCANYLDFAVGNVDVFPLVITLRKNDRLVGLLPLSLQENGSMKVLTGLTEPYQQYTDILLADEIEPSEIAEQLFAELNKSGADYFHSGQVRLGSNLANALENKASKVGEKDAAPFVKLTDWDNFDEYFKSIKPKTRKNMRNARNRLSKTAPLGHKVSDNTDFVSEVIDRAYEGREAWLERLGITSRAFRNSDFKGFLDRFKGRNVTGVDVMAMTLSHGDEPMSDQWGFVYRGRYYAFMATWNEAYEGSSPGKLHLGEVIEACYEQDIEVADFMIPASSYKFTWADKAAPVRDFVYPMSVKGYARCTLWLGFLRPLAKRIFTLIPAGLRGFLLNTLLRK